MIAYIVRRVVLMVPTFFAISLIVFLFLNFAPGRPGGAQAGAQGEQDAISAEAKESYQIFKEQFNFDKPVLFNTRFWLGDDDIREHLETIVNFSRPLCEATSPAPNCIELRDRPSPKGSIQAEEELEDWGHFAVPGLLQAAEQHPTLAVRLLALQHLPLNGRERLHSVYSKTLTPEQLAHNKRADAHNQRLGQWRLTRAQSRSADTNDASLAQTITDQVSNNWQPWFTQNAARFNPSFGEKLRIFFFDTRFAKYWGNLARFDFGVSHVDKQPVLATILSKLKYSITLGFLSVVLAYFISVPLGVWSAYRQHTLADRVVTVVLFMLYSLPSFFVGVLMLEYLTVGDPFDWFPTGGFVAKDADQLTVIEYIQSAGWHLVLPVICLTYGALASLSRYARGGLLDVIRADYIRTARAKGLSEPMVIIKHAVRNGMIPILTLLGSLLPTLIGGSVIIEYLFGIPGMGLYLFDSITQRDYNAIMGVLLMSTVLTLFGFLLSDLAYAVVDPRISFD